MLSERELSAAIGSTAYGPDGEKIGTVEHFFTDDRTGAPTWAAVSTGLFGTRHSVVPAAEATFADGVLRLPVTKDAVRGAPAVSHEHLDPDDEATLRRHYGLDSGGGPAPADAGRADSSDTVAVPPGGPAGAGPAPTGTAAAPARASDAAMTRSEEQLRVGTERVATTRARLVKYVVTEEVTITVPIRREEIRVEEVPLDAPDPGPGESLVATGPGAPAGAATEGAVADRGTPSGTPGTGLPAEIVLHAERPVVSVEVVPVERVRLRTEVVQGHEQVTEQVQREQIVVDEERRGED